MLAGGVAACHLAAPRPLSADFEKSTGKMRLVRVLLALLFTAAHDAMGAGQSCNLTQLQECYSSTLDNVVAELSQQQPDPSLYEDLCKKYGATSQCGADVEPCLTSFPAARDMERLYSAIHQEACDNLKFTLLKSLAPTAECTPLPLIVNCVQRHQLQFDNSTEDAGAACNDLRAGLLSCFVAPDVKCPKHRKRLTYARKTLATMMETRGCDAGNGKTAPESGGRTQGGPGGGQDGSNDEKCWYKTLKRCDERQINDIQAKMSRMLARNMLPDDNFSTGICRKARKTCHQHSTVESCVAHEQDAIRRLEEAMDEAQALLCKDNKVLLKNLLLSYKWWDIKHFTECSTDFQVNSITDFLYNTPRIHTDCRLLKSRLFRCLNESYAAADEADPKPDVGGARMVLAMFLDRMTCVDAADLPLVDDGTRGPSDAGEIDYSGDEPAGNATNAHGSAMPITSDAESGAASSRGQKSALAGFVSLMAVLTLYLVQS